ncbi:WD and tetratricopeptide repeats protein 1 [Harpegnathos saltator]|uniref:WD and tetratricopeptide repeats protein 1 n=1 Tax=Harpegnathos saltator TaxID=610380 RepID=E2C805_HARSA|nr:WD and tetratricopeptide repeats protein 1 [Harpegnathos saltator]EFN75923.1 WD and tetratricopeptide repeats protein 1 [Harpegnathos saltator]
MDLLPNIQKKGYRVLDLVRQREIHDIVPYTIQQKLQVTGNLISRLGLEKELNGHTGCVNCLEWNESGQILASASDDKDIILWDPFRYEKKLVLHTGHHGNIFSVKFMPKSNDRVLVSGAGDCRIRVYDLAFSYTEPIFTCKCHRARVKRIATAPSIPFLFWSAGEDGLFLQYDMRTPHVCRSEDRNVLVNLIYHAGNNVEGKCISVNSKKPELIAVGANDAYIRMYDRRMIKLSQIPPCPTHVLNTEWVNFTNYRAGKGDPDDNIPLGSVQYFIAGHLRSRDSNRSITTTYLTFSDDGNELLVNMGGEQIYLFDINNPKHSKAYLNCSPKKYTELGSSCVEQSDMENMEDFTEKNVKVLPPHVEELKREANEGFEQQKFSLAINLYNKAICRCPTAAVLFANRAAAYMKRAWDGDIYAALRDCKLTLLLDPEHIKAHFRLARCLFDLNRALEADKILKNFQQKFPEYVSNSSCKALRMDIKEAIDNGRDYSQSNHLQFPISEYEQEWRRNSIDYKMRFCGHCNTTTDIKEANFFGNNGQYIVAGSDDGSFFIWDRSTTNIVRVLRGDDRIVNCLQPHPSTCLLATSGIDPVIRLWSPLPEDGRINEREIRNLDDAASANQIRMNSDPFEIMLMNMGYRLPAHQGEFSDEDGEDQRDVSFTQALNCRPS